MKTLSIKLLCAASILLAIALDVSAAAPRSRQIQGTIESVKLQERELTVQSKETAHQDFIWTKQTKFIQDNQFTEPASLQSGTSAQVSYRSPFFGRKFVTKVKWGSNPVQER